MKGYPLCLFKEPLYEVPSSESLFPVSTRDRLLYFPAVHDNPDLMDIILSPEWKELLKDFSLLFLLKNFSFEEIARINYSDVYLFTERIRRGIEDTPQFRILQKIQSSFWRWGNNNDDNTFNIAVAVYEQLRTFSIPLPGFEVSIDWTTGYNPRGYSESLRLFLDGVFGFFIHYKGEHVMTVGFSFTDTGELLLQQIQLVNHKGNRFLYALPTHYMEWVTNLMKSHFSGRKVFMVDGKSLADSIHNQYMSQVTRYRDEFKRHRSFLYRGMTPVEEESIYRDLKYHYDGYKGSWRKVLSFRSKDSERIASLYARVRCVKNKQIKRNGLIFRPLLKKPA